MDANGDKILIDGNTATALGCVYAGATVAAWYPITPSTSVMDAFKGFCEQYRRDPDTGKNNYIILQAEDELAAIGMVIGASWNGARAFTSTAGPGHFADERTAGPGVLRRNSGGDHRRAARGAVHRHAHAHPAGRHSGVRLRLARRHETYPAVPVESGRVLRIRGQVLRSGGAFSDAGVHAVRSRHRHERLGDAAPDVGRFLPPRSRPRADRRGAGARSPSISAIRREDENFVAARTLPGVDSKGAYLHSRLRPQQARRLHRDSGRIPGSDGSAARRSTRPRRNSCRRPRS